MPARLHQTRASAEALDFVGRDALMAVPFAAVAAFCLYHGIGGRSVTEQVVLLGGGGVFALVALALAVVRQRLSLALGTRSYVRWRRFGPSAGTRQGSLDEITGVTLDTQAQYGTDGGAPTVNWVVLLEFRDPTQRVQVAEFVFSAQRAYLYAIELARRLKTAFIDKSGFTPLVTPWADLDKPIVGARRKQPFPALPAGARADVSGAAPERAIVFAPAGWRPTIVAAGLFCALVMGFGAAGFFGLVGTQRYRLDVMGHAVPVWWIAPLAFFALGLLGLSAVILAGASRLHIRESAEAIAVVKRVFGRPWRAIEFRKAAIIVIEHRLDPIRVRAARHEVLVRAPGQVLRLREGALSNGELAWLALALLAML
jgi:hypothetical protein